MSDSRRHPNPKRYEWRHKEHRETNPPLRGSNHNHHESPRDQSDALSSPWQDRPPSYASGPATPISSRSHARPHTQRLAHAVKSNEGPGSILDDMHHFPLLGSNPSNSSQKIDDSDVSRTLSGSAKLDKTLNKKPGIAIAIPYNLVDGRDSNVNKRLLDHNEGTNTTLQTNPKEQKKPFRILRVLPRTQNNTTGPGDSNAGASGSHSAPVTKSTGPQPRPSSSATSSLRPYPGLFVYGKTVKHPVLITRVTQRNRKRVIMACLCTSRPQMEKLIEQYETRMKTNYSYIGGRKEGAFYTGTLKIPKVAELDIDGPPMDSQTFIQLEEMPFGLDDLDTLRGERRELFAASLEKLLNQLQLLGRKHKKF